MLVRLVFSALIFLIGVQDSLAAVRLTSRQKEALTQQVVPAYRMGNPRQLLHALSPVVSKMDDEFILAANELLDEQRVPRIEQLLADAHLTLVELNQADHAPKPGRRELLLTLKALGGRIDEVLADLDGHPVMKDPLPNPKSLKTYKQWFWELHVLDNRLSGASRTALYAAKLRGKSDRLNPAAMTAKQRTVMETDFFRVAADIQRRRQELEERDIALRLNRINLSAEFFELVESQSEDSKRFVLRYPKGYRLRAAYAIGLDGRLVAEFLKARKANPNKKFIVKHLDDPKLAAAVQQKVEKASTQAGDLVKKTELLHTGLHWWMRGRYGAGPDAWGMLKHTSALKSPQAQFPLYMPQSAPRPTDPVEQNAKQVPSIDRRHHYAWTTQYRPITTQSRSTQRNVVEETKPQGYKVIHLGRFY